MKDEKIHYNDLTSNKMTRILDNLLEGCQIINHEWQYIYLNKECEKQANRNKEELLGHTMMECYPGIENTELFEKLQTCMKKRIPASVQNEFTYPDGNTGWFELRIEPVPEGIFILSIDITDKRKAEIELQRQLKNLKTLREIDLAILGSTDITLSLKTVLRELSTQLHIDACEILLLNPYTLFLEPTVNFGFLSNNHRHPKVRLGEGYIGKMGFSQKTKFLNRINLKLTTGQDEYLNFVLTHEEDFKATYITPLISKGKTRGVLVIFLKNSIEPEESWFDFIETIAGQTAIAIENNKLFNEVHMANLNLLLAYDTTIEGWSRALDLRDKETEGHSLRVTELTVELAQRIGIEKDDLLNIKRGSLLHDIGKMGIPDAILLKPGKLTVGEWHTMKMHPTFAYELLSPIRYLNKAIEIPYCHHEKWDGSGYPRGLKGEQIPIAAQIFAIVDVWDALSSERPYRPSWSRDQVINYIQHQIGSHFNPRLAELFLDTINK